MDTPEEIDAQINKSLEESAAKQLDEYFNWLWNMVSSMCPAVQSPKGYFCQLDRSQFEAIFFAGRLSMQAGIGVPMRMLSGRMTPRVEKKDDLVEVEGQLVSPQTHKYICQLVDEIRDLKAHIQDIHRRHTDETTRAASRGELPGQGSD